MCRQMIDWINREANLLRSQSDCKVLNDLSRVMCYRGSTALIRAPILVFGSSWCAFLRFTTGVALTIAIGQVDNPLGIKTAQRNSAALKCWVTSKRILPPIGGPPDTVEILRKDRTVSK
jgi:hypothetical protein